MRKRYEVYYVLNNDELFKKNYLISTDNLDDAIECYANFIYDNYFNGKIDYCLLIDNKGENYRKHIMYTDFLI